MRKSAFVSCLVGCLGALAACGDDTSDNNGAAGHGSNAGSGGTVESPDPINVSCPQTGPMDGPYAPKGDCCYRTSNKARIDPTASERTLEYRTNFFLPINHRASLDPAIFYDIQNGRYNSEQQSLLIRLTMPQKDGEVVDGKGRMTLGAGRYNCDGTYSFYSETAAKKPGGDNDPARWSVPEFTADVHADRTDASRIRPSYNDSLALKNKPKYLPYLIGGSNYGIDFEGESQGFDIIEMPSGPDNLDCVGSYVDATWEAGGKAVSYARLDMNNDEKIDSIGLTFCQLMAFTSTTEVGKENPDCLTTPRCTPGEPGCKWWKRLPDSLCPDKEQQATWGCHLGYGGNPDNEAVPLNCSPTLPSEINPDNGTKTGQCCDPLGKNTNGLPTCNAWLQINKFVAAAVEITDARADDLQMSCD
jgi:hypothetical protein